ncbi:MAG: hypothetical protein ACRDZX_01260 [Acidimicrobiales bacterium]
MTLKAPKRVFYKGASVLLAVGTMSSLMLSGTGVALAASSGSAPTVSVGANISGGGSGPTVECSWMLTDDNLSGGGETQQYSFATGKNVGPGTSGLSYTNYTQPANSLGSSSSSPNAPSFPASANAAHGFNYGLDDQPNNYPATPNCTSSGQPASEPAQAAGSQGSPVSTGIQVQPNAFDSATNSVSSSGTAPRRVEIWAAVDNASAVDFNVYYPDGSEDTQLGAVEIGGSTTACSGYGTAGNILTNMFAQAGPVVTDALGNVVQGSNQVSATAITNQPNGTGIVDLCNDNEKSLWHQAFTISKDDPNGTYTVEVQAINSGGTALGWISFQVLPFYFLATDFSSVTFTKNASATSTFPGGTVYWASGDTNLATPSLPTVTNGGNSGEEVGVNFGALTYAPPVGSNYYITNFDANLGYNSSDVMAKDVQGTGASVNPANNATTWITNNPGAPATSAQLVCPNDTPKLDLSAEPNPSNTAPGNYTGSLQVVAEADAQMGTAGQTPTTTGGCLTDNGMPYLLSNGNWKSLTDLDPNPVQRYPLTAPPAG